MANGTEIGNAYVTIIPSLRGASKKIEADLKGLDTSKVGKSLGTDLGESINSALGDAVDVTPVTKKLDGLGSDGSKALGLITAAAPVAGAAVAAIGAVAIDAAADFDTAEARITAAVGGVGEQADALMEAGRDLYEDGWGESMTQLSDSLINAREILGDISEEDMSGAVEGALALEEVYGSDFSETLRGARVLMEKFGLSSEDAMDLMVAGTQRGLDYTDELGDNLSEYAGRWADAGIEASEYFSLLEAGADNGAYSLDKVGDFLNEFLTSLTDGRMDEAIGKLSDGTQATFDAFKNGGADARDVLDAVVGELSEMPSGYEKAQIASELWSSLGEDNAMSMIEALGGVEDTFDDVAGASQEMTDQVSNDLGSKWDAAIRKWQSLLEPVGQVAVDAFGGLADLIGSAGDALHELTDSNVTSSLDDIAEFFGGFGSSTYNALAHMGYDAQELNSALVDAGVTVEELDSIGGGHIRSLASTFNGSVESMVWAIENYNDVPIIEKDGTVNVNDAELIDAQGRIWTWNGTTFVDQEGNVIVDDQELIDAQGRVWVWNNETGLEPKNTRVTVDTSEIDFATAKWRRASFPAKVTRVAVQGATVGQLTQAEGGIIPGASTKGFIATGPTLLDGGTRLVGEAGAEAVFDYGGSNYVVPLTNKTYSAPFADLIAGQVARTLGRSASGGETKVVNVYIDGVGTEARVESIALNLLDELEKLGKV